MLRFPDTFLWGAATASYQIEGSPLADGAGPSIWHRFCHTPGNVANGDTGDVACDHYNRWRDDVALMAGLGLKAYRFSIAWPRVVPDGTGATNDEGLAFYDRLVDALLDAGIEPIPTLYHWDLPAALQDAGGWANPAAADAFASYARVMFDRLGDRVTRWITLNEPWVVAHLGYIAGRHAPGIRDLWAGLRAMHVQLLAHARAVKAFRERETPGEIGITVNLSDIRPDTDRPEDVAAAGRSHAYLNRMFLDPVLLGTYPRELIEWFGDAWHGFDAAEVKTPVDFVGVNYYVAARQVYERGTGLLHARSIELPGPRTSLGWPVTPEGLHGVLTWLRDTYGNPPVLITENGSCWDDAPDARGEIDDPDRAAYIDAHLRQAHRAIADGCDLRGYLVWSLLDNFEWAEGYAKRFGIVRVDDDTQARTIKRSGRAYADTIARGGPA